MVRHHHELMQLIFLHASVLVHDFNEQPGDLFHLEQASLFHHISSDEVCGFGWFFRDVGFPNGNLSG